MIKNLLLVLMIAFIPPNVYAGRIIKGIVLNAKGSTLDGVTVMIDETTIGTSTITGKFELNVPDPVDVIILTFRMMGYKNKSVYVPQGQDFVTVTLEEDILTIKGVVVKPPRYARMGNYMGQVTNLTPLEIYTNPQALGDVIGGLKILPSVQTSETDGRLIIQGGATDESQIFVDGLLIYNPYTLSSKNTSVRSRFSPDLFTGISLFTGGYPAQFGQGLSGILELNTMDKDGLSSKIDLNISSIGIESSIMRNNLNNAFRLNASYADMTPYSSIFPDSYEWHRHFHQWTGDAFLYNNLSPNTILKTNVYYSTAGLDYSYHNIDSTTLRNNLSENYLMASSILETKNGRHNFYAGANFIHDQFKGTGVSFANDSLKTINTYSHIKVSDTYLLNENAVFMLGADNMYNRFRQNYRYGDSYDLYFDGHITSLFGAVSFTMNYISANFSVRAEHYSLTGGCEISPRVYLGFKPAPKHTLAISSGVYYQNPSSDYLKYTGEIKPQRSVNTNLTYNYIIGNSKFSFDAFYKDYSRLITYETAAFYLSDLRNDGRGYAYGMNVFWKHNIRNLEYWLTYSFMRSEIKNKNHLFARQPEYVSPHTFRITTKYWISELRSLVGMSYFIDSGAEYSHPYDPAIRKSTQFRSKLDLSWSYLPVQSVIIHFSCQNVLGRHNVYGYSYSPKDKRFKKITTSSTRFFYLGVFITFSNSNINQLKSL